MFEGVFGCGELKGKERVGFDHLGGYIFHCLNTNFGGEVVEWIRYSIEIVGLFPLAMTLLKEMASGEYIFSFLSF